MARERKYKTPEEMQTQINAYFDECAGRPPTMTGLALFLGFTTRQALLNYKPRGRGFLDAITRARSRIEAYAEERLYDRDGQRGAEFNLKCNFGWNDKSDATDTDKLDAILSEVKRNAAEQ